MSANWIQPMPTAEAYAIDRILYDVQHNRDQEARFFADPDAYMAPLLLSDRARTALSANDIGQIYLLGANPYLLRAYCLQLRVPEADYLGQLRAVAGQAANG